MDDEELLDSVWDEFKKEFVHPLLTIVLFSMSVVVILTYIIAHYNLLTR